MVQMATIESEAAIQAHAAPGTVDPLTSEEIAARLGEMERADATASSAYRGLVGEYFAALKREQEARQQVVLARASEVLGRAGAGKLEMDSAELGQLLSAMQRALLSDTPEFSALYRIWLDRFPQDATQNLVEDWLRRWQNQYGAFLGFTACGLILEYAGSLGDETNREAVERVLHEMAGRGELIAAPVGEGWAMYALGWMGRGSAG